VQARLEIVHGKRRPAQVPVIYKNRSFLGR